MIAVNIAAGDSVTAGSTTETIVIQGAGGYEATTTVSLAKVAEVQVGATATVLPDGSSTAYSGKVVSVAAVPTTSTTGTSSFAVAIALDGDTSALHNGGIGSVAIVTGSSTATLAVPTSAVTTDGTQPHRRGVRRHDRDRPPGSRSAWSARCGRRSPPA